MHLFITYYNNFFLDPLARYCNTNIKITNRILTRKICTTIVLYVLFNGYNEIQNQNATPSNVEVHPRLQILAKLLKARVL